MYRSHNATAVAAFPSVYVLVSLCEVSKFESLNEMRRNRTLSEACVKGICPPGRRNVMHLIFHVPSSFRRQTTCIVSCSNSSDVPRMTIRGREGRILAMPRTGVYSHAKSRFRVDVMRSASNRGVYCMHQRRRRD